MVGGLPCFAMMTEEPEAIIARLWFGPEGEEQFGYRNFLELYSVFTSPPLFTVLHGRTELGLVHESSFLSNNPSDGVILLLAGRSWQVSSVDWTHRRAYVAPYDTWANRISTIRFMQDIPLGPQEKAWPLLEASGKALPSFADRPVFLGWGLKDFVFDKHFLDGFRAALPDAEVHAYEDAGHYVLEDKHEILVPLIRDFLDRHPLA